MGLLIEKGILKRIPVSDVVGMFRELADELNVRSVEVRRRMWRMVANGQVEIGDDLSLMSGPGVEQGKNR
ncbi:hypothetical protein A2634_01860 [Candidatus Amesbacteria bacterium RIFCSPHIGHO2_01_FULL_48_32]|uniref:Uncharacterized protein n=1 Tax=Candidatus Amesbacteria bacterium RIFCSPLOWO2_01_FULL_48_25 TaxID=1797259 RepID=A0A1F4ZEM8_9BACT|nr:MAG: hypothetical protein A2634_01860 [Candidatus Amesbacteria bacterium RIFCSPHIGHO2_01_FULL_48_32]OGD04336.1 MAG: hypothetical protein A2989_04860 [Candidatus Amesbacteria bacterium RIFCSPLOWO2_01_FULL_48_25]HJZ06170.1 hypothetical protein [Patescibacteria group bacterium]